jgi:hypothetical protein
MRRYFPPAVAPADEFDMYGIELDLGDWAYALDQSGVVYGPGWYPFHRPVTSLEPNPAAPLVHHPVETGRTAQTGVRISPDAAHYSWRNEYVALEPFDHRVRARMALFVRRQGMGAMVRRVSIEIDLRNRHVTIPEACPEQLRHQADIKGHRILDLLRAARRERRRGVTIPTAVLGPWDQAGPPER